MLSFVSSIGEYSLPALTVCLPLTISGSVWVRLTQAKSLSVAGRGAVCLPSWAKEERTSDTRLELPGHTVPSLSPGEEVRADH